MNMPKTVIFEQGICGREFMAMHKWCALTGTPFRLSETGNGFDIYQNLFVGSTGFIEKVLDHCFEPDYYPSWASPLISRKIKRVVKAPVRKCFIKPADEYKAFTGFVKENGRLSEDYLADGYWVSDVVSFCQEWRYYVCGGQVIETGWYQGCDEDEPAPVLELLIPEDVYGALDVGKLKDGRIELIEFHHPYGIGWYGENDNAYAEFLIRGWKNLLDHLTD